MKYNWTNTNSSSFTVLRTDKIQPRTSIVNTNNNINPDKRLTANRSSSTTSYQTMGGNVAQSVSDKLRKQFGK